MATGIDGVATALAIIGFSAQIFDGCVKGFVLLSTAHNLGRDADMLRCMLDWEQFRLEQWAEKVNLRDPSQADPSLDWRLIENTLKHIRNLTNDTAILKNKYSLTLYEDSDSAALVPSNGEQARTNTFGSFKKFFSQSNSQSSTAAARVIQSKNHPMKKLWWAAVDKSDFKRLVEDISHFTQRLYDVLNIFLQDQMKASIDAMLQAAIPRSENALDLMTMKQLARLPDIIQSSSESQEEIEERITKQSRNLLFWAVHRQDVGEIEQLIDEGVSVESEDFAGYSPLMRAADYGQVASVKVLLRRGASPLHGTIGQRLPLHFAAEHGYLEIVKSLLEVDKSQLNLQDSQEQSILHKAVRERRRNVVEFLLSQDGIEVDTKDKNGFSPLVNVVEEGGISSDVVRMLLAFPNVDVNHREESFQQTPLWRSVTADNDIMSQLLEHPNIDVNKRGRFGETPVYRAARWSQNAALKLLVAHNADYNLSQFEGLTPLAVAAKENNEEGVAWLLKQAHIEPDRPDEKGCTPLMHAAQNNNVPCLKTLLKHGVNIEAVNKAGCTALLQAASAGHKIPVKFLLKAGANINIQDPSGNTPLAVATVNKRDAVVRFLLENGADAELADEDEETPFEKARDQYLDEVVKIFREVLKMT